MDNWEPAEGDRVRLSGNLGAVNINSQHKGEIGYIDHWTDDPHARRSNYVDMANSRHRFWVTIDQIEPAPLEPMEVESSTEIIA